MLDRLKEEFKRIKENHQNAIIRRTALTALGPSMVRFLPRGTKENIIPTLCRIKFNELLKFNSQDEYQKWFEKNLGKVASKIEIGNSGRRKWAYAAKILNLFLRDVVSNSRFFDDNQANEIIGWLYAPIDKKVLDRLRKLIEKRIPNELRYVDSKKKFYKIQEVLGEAAKKVGVPRVWFDDVWVGNK